MQLSKVWLFECMYVCVCVCVCVSVWVYKHVCGVYCSTQSSNALLSVYICVYGRV